MEAAVNDMKLDIHSMPAHLEGTILAGRTIDDLDINAFHGYRNRFASWNLGHPLNTADDMEFLRQTGCISRDRRTGETGLTAAGLLMFGKAEAVHEEFPDLVLKCEDYTDPFCQDVEVPQNLCGYYSKTVRVLTQGLKVPFRLDGITRVDESYMHVAVREALCNMIIHSDYSHGGVLLAEKFENRFIFTNPGELRVPFDLLREGSVRWSLNPQIEMMFRLIGICDSIGDGYEKMSLAARVRCRVNNKRLLVKFTLEQYA